MGRLRQDTQVIDPNLAPFLRNEIKRIWILFDCAGRLTAKNHRGSSTFIKDLVFAADGVREALRTLLRVDNQVARDFELLRISRVHAPTFEFERSADCITGAIQENEWSGLTLRIEDNAPGGFQRSALARVDSESAPLIGDGILVSGIIRRIFEGRIKVFYVRDVLRTQWRQEVLLHHRTNDVVGRNYNIVQGCAASLDLCEHRLRILVKIDDNPAIETLLKFGDNLRRKIFAVDEDI